MSICAITCTNMLQAAPPTIVVQKEHTRISYSDEIPRAKLRTEPSPLEFSELADAVPLGTAAGTQEHRAWQLLSLLFDDSIQVPSSVPKDQREQWLAQDRKDRLSHFWQSLVFDDAQNHAKEAATHEEKALAYLSCHSIADAITTLFHASDLRLATIVSQLGGDATVRHDMSAQVDEWRKMDELAEMDEPMRALYELIQGNCTKAEGKTGVGRENKASTFQIASRFNLDWRRAFGLRLWYQAMADEPIEMAVAQFADASRDGKEDVKPVPWFIEQGLNMGWDDPQRTQREDILWGILKLYASSKMEIPTNLEDVLAPENVSGHPLDARLSFQLFQIFYSRRIDPSEEDERIVGMPTFRDPAGGGPTALNSSVNSTNVIEQADDPLVELGDRLTLTYASSLHTPEHWTTAAWVYTHLSNPAMRSHHIRSLLNQFSNAYEIAQSDSTYQALLKLSIPQYWMHAAAALQAKCDGDALRQAAHLIKANELQEAHEVLCRSVGPDAIISRHLDPLRELLGGFEDGQTTETITGWVQGGQIYFDYIHLLDLTEQRNPYRPDDKLNHDIHVLLRKLQQSLEKVATDQWDGVSLEERVALSEIAGTVANLMAKNKVCEMGSARYGQ
jgi:nuclear pore complex protein Nup98-Nup96